LTVETRAQRSKQICGITKEVVVDFGWIDHHESATLGLKYCLDVLGSEATKSITMLNQDGGYGHISQQCEKLAAMAIESRSNFARNSIDRVTMFCGPCKHTGNLTVEISFLLSRKNPGIDRCAATLLASRGFKVTH
jgi:hypothetical protein